MTEQRTFNAGIIDYNPTRMSATEAKGLGIPPELQDHLADKRQYAPNIARHFPIGVSWFNPDHPWWVEAVMSNPAHVDYLKSTDALILSGGGQSAYKFQERVPGAFTPEQRETLEGSQEVTLSVLGSGKLVFSICLGGQLAINAVGGKIGRLPEGKSGVTPTEAGWLDHQLTDAGKKDEIFGSLPETFYAPHLHSDFVAELPPLGQKVKTEHGTIAVVRTEILATRNGYLYKGKLHNPDKQYIHASLVEFDNGARLYQIQPHPEMATAKKANFLVRQNQAWLEKDIGPEYFATALAVPENADFSVSQTITKFVELAKKRAQELNAVEFVAANLSRAIEQYLIE